MSDIDVTITPSNTIDVEFSGTAGLHTVSNVAYDATTWNGAEAIAPSKNAVRDKVETMDTAIGLNTAKDTNVSTSLSLGTINATTVSITSDGGADDVTLAEADTTNAGLLGSDKWDEIVANSLKATNATHTGDVTGATALTIGVDKVLVTHINWGVAATQVSAVDLVIADAGVIITATEVEGALQENRTAINLNTDKVTNATLFKTGDSSFTDDDTEQTFNDAFCTATSLVVVSITGATPAGIWSVVSAAGSFTITSSSAESTDITFDYYITKAV